MNISSRIYCLIFLATWLAGCRPVAVTESIVPTAEPMVASSTDNAAPTPTGEKSTLNPQPSPVAFDPAYSPSQPITDTQQMFEILEALHELELANLAQPGWYLRYDLGTGNSMPEDEILRNIVHVTDQNGHCLEQLSYFLKDGHPSAFLFMGADGSRGSVNQLTGQVTPYDLPPDGCDLVDASSLMGMGTEYYILNNKIAAYRQTLASMGQPGSPSGEFSAWFAREDGQDVFVVQFSSSGPTGGVSIDPVSGVSLAITQITQRDVYELTSGRLLRSEEEDALENGEKLNRESIYILEYYPELPEELRAALDQAVGGLVAS